MISELMFMFFHQKEYGGGFWKNYKQMREIKKMNKYMEKEQNKRLKLFNEK